MMGLHASAKELAARLAQQFAALPLVEAVAVGGSQRSSVADELSDIDLYVYTRGAIPLAERRAIVERAGGADQAQLGLSFWGPSDSWFDRATGLEMDVTYFDAAWMEQQLQSVLHEHRASLGYSTCFWRTIRQSQRLYDRREWFQNLQQQSQVPYPEALRRNIIALNHPVLRNAIPSYLRQIEKAVERGDQVSVNHRVAALLASYFDVLFAVNRLLHPGEKRLLAFATGHCPQQPVGLASDLPALLGAVADGWRLVPQLHALLDRLDQLLAQAGLEPHLLMGEDGP